MSAKALQNNSFFNAKRPLLRGDEGENGENEVPAAA
jgi:hypothetical protein